MKQEIDMNPTSEQIIYAISHDYNSITRCNTCGKTFYLTFANGLRNGWGLCCSYTPTLIWHNADIAKAVIEIFNEPKPKIIGCRCSCGHLQEDHEDTNEVGRGKCLHCDCESFRWKEFIYGHNR